MTQTSLVFPGVAGSSIRNVAPPPGVSATLILPPCARHDRGGDAQTQPTAALVAAAQWVGTMKTLEDPLALRSWYPGPVVDHVDLGVSVLRLQRDLNGTACGRVHKGVADQVRDRLAQPKVVAGHDQRRLDARDDRAPRVGGAGVS